MYLVSNYVMMPIDSILGIPSVVLVVGLFMGILKGYSKYLLYAISILSCIPEMYIEYEKDLITNRALFEIYLRKYDEVVKTPTQTTEPSIFSNIILIAFFAFVFVYSVKYIVMNYKNILNRVKLILIMLSLPIFISMLPMFIMVPLILYFNLTINNILLPSTIDRITWICAIQVVARSIVVLVFGPIYGYFVFRSIGLYKRLGIEK